MKRLILIFIAILASLSTAKEMTQSETIEKKFTIDKKVQEFTSIISEDLLALQKVSS